MAFPTTLSNYITGSNSAPLATAGHAAAHNSLEAKVGADGSAVQTSHDYKLSGVTTGDKAVSLTGTETLTNKTLTSPKINEDVAITATATELNYVDGVTSAIQTQLGTKAPIASPTFTGTVTMPTALTGLAKMASGVVSAVTAPSGTVVGTSDTQTLTNKAVTQRVVTTTDDATAVIDCTITDQYQLSAIANNTEFTVTGTPTDGQKLIIRYKDAGTPKTLTFTGFTAIGVTIPTTTVANKWCYVGSIYNLAATTWHVLAVGQEA